MIKRKIYCPECGTEWSMTLEVAESPETPISPTWDHTEKTEPGVQSEETSGCEGKNRDRLALNAIRKKCQAVIQADDRLEANSDMWSVGWNDGVNAYAKRILALLVQYGV